MKTKVIEAHDATRFNYGKFLVGRFDTEWSARSLISGHESVLASRGWRESDVLVLDLETGEGILVSPGGFAAADLDKHAVWVCPLFEPFLSWLYKQDLLHLDGLPSIVDLGDVPTSLVGRRRAGPTNRH